MKSDHTAWFHQSHHLVDNSLRFRNIHKHQPSSRQIKRFTRKASGFGVSLMDLDIPDLVVRQVLSGEPHEVRIDLNTNYGARRTYSPRQDFKAAERPAANLYSSRVRSYADPVE
jgi:hypothetical protein